MNKLGISPLSGYFQCLFINLLENNTRKDKKNVIIVIKGKPNFVHRGHILHCRKLTKKILGLINNCRTMSL